MIACAVWVGGFEVAPFLHVVDHARLAPHAHAEEPAHCHGGACHEHEDEAPDPEHGDGSLAHRGLAAHSAPPALPPIDPPRIGAVSFAQDREGLAPLLARARARARAPPG